MLVRTCSRPVVVAAAACEVLLPVLLLLRSSAASAAVAVAVGTSKPKEELTPTYSTEIEFTECPPRSHRIPRAPPLTSDKVIAKMIANSVDFNSRVLVHDQLHNAGQIITGM